MNLNKGLKNGTLKLNCRSLYSVIVYRRVSATTYDLTAEIYCNEIVWQPYLGYGRTIQQEKIQHLSEML